MPRLALIVALTLAGGSARATVTRQGSTGLSFQGTVEAVVAMAQSRPLPALDVDADSRWYVEVREVGSSSDGTRLRQLCGGQLIRLAVHSPTTTFGDDARRVVGQTYSFHLTEKKEGGRTVGWSLSVGPPSFLPADAQALGLPEPLAQLLLSRIWVGTPPAFRIIALSQLADGCARRKDRAAGAAQRCVNRALVLALNDPPAHYQPKHADDTGLYASHLNLILGAQDRVGGEHNAPFHEAVSRALAERSRREPTRHVPSFFNGPLRWPADQSATLASLHRSDAAHGTALAPPLVAAWRAFLEGHSVEGLPWSEVTGQAKHARLPRGCALSFGIRYTAEFDPALARKWWALYKQRYLVNGLLSGFREWPPGQDLPADADSGPIVMGVGASATAFGLAAARALGDEATAGRLETTARAMGQAATLSPELAHARDSTLAQAILFQAAP